MFGECAAPPPENKHGHRARILILAGRRMVGNPAAPIETSELLDWRLAPVPLRVSVEPLLVKLARHGSSNLCAEVGNERSRRGWLAWTCDHREHKPGLTSRRATLSFVMEGRRRGHDLASPV